MVVFECSSACVCVLREGWRVSSHQYMQVNGNIQVYKKVVVGKEDLSMSLGIRSKVTSKRW